MATVANTDNSQISGPTPEGSRALQSRQSPQAIDVSAELIASIDFRTGTAFVTDQLARLLGYVPGSLTGAAIDDLFEPADLRCIDLTGADPEPDQPEPVRFSCRVRQADGQLRALDLLATPLTEAGEVRAVLLRAEGLFAARLEQALDRTEKRYRALVAHSSDIISVFGRDGTWLESSEAGTRLLGYPKGYDPEGGILSIVHPDDLPVAMAAFEEVVTGARGPTEPVAFRVRAADGTWRTFESLGQDLTDDPDVQGILVVSSDVTHRVGAERALIESEERFRLLADAASDGVCIASDLHIESANSTFARMYGYEPEEVIGLSVELFVEPDEWPGVRQYHESGRAAQGEFIGVRKDGSRFPIAKTARSVAYNGRTVRVVTITDLTEQKRSAALEERRRIARDLHDGLAQELAFIGTQVRALQDQLAWPPLKLAVLERAAERALDEARRAITLLSSTDEQSLAQALTETAEELTDRHDVELWLDVATDVSSSSDRTENLLRILREAITNAARHGQPRRVTVRLWRDGPIHLAIEDDGCGFDVTAPTRGFGMFSMRERAEALGGSFHIVSSPGAGTRIEVVLPS